MQIYVYTVEVIGVFRSIYDEQLMGQLHRILVLKSTFVEKLKVKLKLNHQSILNIYVQVEQ